MHKNFLPTLSSLILAGTILCTLPWAMSACREFTCVDLGCPFGQTCNTTSGLCEAPQNDCRQRRSLCSQDEYCDQNTGRCLSNRSQCGRDQAQCPRGQACNAERGVCQAINSCFSSEDCPNGEQCNMNTGECEPVPCERPQDCEAGFVCIENQCTAGCLDTKPCPTSQFCRVDEGAAFGACVSECNSHQECNFGYVCECEFGISCDLAGPPPTCRPEPPCEEDSGCRVDEICGPEGRCIEPPCSNNEECLENQVCDLTTGKCIGANCVEDTFSPNHTTIQAAQLEQAQLTQLSKCPGRPDWYKLDLTAGEQLTATLEDFTSDLDLYLFDGSLRPLQVDEQFGPEANLTYQSTQDGRVYLVVDGPLLKETTYDLSIQRRASGACLEDSFEENDSLQEARSVSPTPQTSVDLPLRLCNEDEDWFVIKSLDPNLGLEVDATAVQISPQAFVYTPDGARLEVPDDKKLSLTRVGSKGDYYIQIKANNKKSGAYRLTLSTPRAPVCENASAASTPEAAILLPTANTLSNHTFCPVENAWELDWLAIQPPTQTSILTVKIAPENTPGFIAALFASDDQDPTPRLIRSGASKNSSSVELVAQVEPNQNLFVRLSSEDLVSRIATYPTYQIVYQYLETPSQNMDMTMTDMDMDMKQPTDMTGDVMDMGVQE